MNLEQIKRHRFFMSRLPQKTWKTRSIFFMANVEIRSKFLNEVQQEHLGGVFMEMKFDKFEEFKRGNYDMVSVIGTVSIPGFEGSVSGETYKADFFKTQKEMLEVVEKAKSGDTLDITLKKNGQWYNPISIVNVGSSGKTDATNDADNSTTETQITVGASDKVISAQIAAQVASTCFAAGITDDDEISQCLIQCLRNAGVVEDYLNARGPFAFDGASNDVPADGMDDDGDGTVNTKEKSTKE